MCCAGCYYALAGGNTTEALVDLTGGAGMKLKLTHPKYQQEAITGALWDRLQRYVQWGYLLGCAYSPRHDANLDPDAVEPDAPDGACSFAAWLAQLRREWRRVGGWLTNQRGRGTGQAFCGGTRTASWTCR
jgi:hypothetical protein